MLQYAYLLAKIGADTAENERHFAENLPKNWQLPYGSCGRVGAGGHARPARPGPLCALGKACARAPGTFGRPRPGLPQLGNSANPSQLELLSVRWCSSLMIYNFETSQ